MNYVNLTNKKDIIKRNHELHNLLKYYFKIRKFPGKFVPFYKDNIDLLGHIITAEGFILIIISFLHPKYILFELSADWYELEQRLGVDFARNVTIATEDRVSSRDFKDMIITVDELRKRINTYNRNNLIK